MKANFVLAAFVLLGSVASAQSPRVKTANGFRAGAGVGNGLHQLGMNLEKKGYSRAAHNGLNQLGKDAMQALGTEAITIERSKFGKTKVTVMKGEHGTVTVTRGNGSQKISTALNNGDSNAVRNLSRTGSTLSINSSVSGGGEYETAGRSELRSKGKIVGESIVDRHKKSVISRDHKTYDVVDGNIEKIRQH